MSDIRHRAAAAAEAAKRAAALGTSADETTGDQGDPEPPTEDDGNGEKSRGQGRPKKPDDERRDQWQTFRVTKKEKERIEDRAERAGKAPAIFCREASLGAPMQTAEAREAKNEKIRQLSKIGGNLNQIARRANQGKGIDRGELSATLEAVREAISEA